MQESKLQPKKVTAIENRMIPSFASFLMGLFEGSFFQSQLLQPLFYYGS